MSETILQARDLTIQYETDEGPLTAVSDATFAVDETEYFGLVGESGCGKSTIAKSIVGGLDSNGSIVDGELYYRDHPLHEYDEKAFNKHIRWNEISWIPQGAMESLDPLQRIQEQAIEIAQVHTDLTKREALEKIKEMFDIVGIQESRVSDYPHQFSGGMQQRAIIALGLFLEPSLIIADEPTTSLDVIMQDQIFKYLDRIQEDSETSMILITHDVSLVFESCERMAVMHSGQLAETGSVAALFDDPRHPYSILLKNAFPDIRFPGRELEVIDGHPPQTLGTVDYCTFASRCPWAVEECQQSSPPLEPASDGESHVACFREDEVHELYESGDPTTAEVTDEF